MAKTAAQIRAELETGTGLSTREKTKLSPEIKVILDSIELSDITIEDSPEESTPYYRKGRELYKLAQETKNGSYYDEALLALNTANTLSPNNAVYLVDRALVYVELKQLDLAERDLDTVSALPAKTGTSGIYVANTIKDLQKVLKPQAAQPQVNQSEPLARKSVERATVLLDSEKVHQQMAQIIKNAKVGGKFSPKVEGLLRDITFYDRAIKRNPLNADAYFLKATTFQALDNEIGGLFSESALTALDKANELSPNNPYYLVARAELCVKMGRNSLAQQDLNAIAALPKDEDIQIATHVEVTSMQVRKALFASSAVTTTPQAAAAEKLVNLVSQDQSKPTPMITDAQPTLVKLSRIAMKALEDIKDYDEGIKNFPIMHEWYTLKAGALITLANETKNGTYLDQALDTYHAVIELYPDYPHLLVGRAELYFQMKQYALAQQDIDAAQPLPIEDDFIGQVTQRNIVCLKKALLQQSTTAHIPQATRPKSPLVALSLLANGEKPVTEVVAADIAPQVFNS